MIAKANLHAHGQKLAAYLITGKMGERAELVELKGFASSNIRDAFLDVMIQAEATRCEKPFFHCYIRLPAGEALTRGQWQHIADRIEKQLGFDGQGRAVAFHHDHAGHETHMHMAWSRIDLDEMRAIDPGLYKNKLKEISRQLERELGLSRLSSERDPQHKTLAPGRDEFEQSRRLGTDIRAIRETIRDCWERSDDGKSFEAALAEHGYILARGDRRDFVVIDAAGGDHALGKRITGATAAETRARLGDIDKAHLPGVDQAKAMQAERAARSPAFAPQPDREISEHQPPGINAPAATPARPIVAPEPESTPQPEISAPARDETHEAAPAIAAAPLAQPAPGAAARDAGIRQPGDIAVRFTGGMLKALGAVFDFLASMISPPKPPTRDEAERIERAAEERAVTRAAAEQEAQYNELLDQLARDKRQREDDLTKRLEDQLRRDLSGGRDRDGDYSRGRERER